MPLKPWNPGDPLSAGRLNATNAQAMQSRRAVVHGPGQSMVGDNFGPQAAHHLKPNTVLCVATEDFKANIITDNYQAVDVVPSGKCLTLRFSKTYGDYREEQKFQEFRVWDPLAEYGGSEMKAEGDVFYAAYNKDSGRLEAIGGGGGGAKIIAFAIVSTDPTNRSALVEIRQRTFPGKVYGSILEDTVVTVYDTDGCYLNEPNVDLTGRLGKATLMYIDEEAAAAHFEGYTSDSACDDYNTSSQGCLPLKYWNVISLCCPSTICEV